MGGAIPRVTRLAVDGVGVRPTEGAIVELLEQMHDISVKATCEPEGDLLVRVGLGVDIVIPAHTALQIEGGSSGPPDAPRIDRPLRLAFDGDGLRLSHEVRWVARLAEIRLGRATLHPDGTVALEARGPTRAADLALRLPLRRAAVHLTELARRSPKIRSFLKR